MSRTQALAESHWSLPSMHRTLYLCINFTAWALVGIEGNRISARRVSAGLERLPRGFLSAGVCLICPRMPPARAPAGVISANRRWPPCRNLHLKQSCSACPPLPSQLRRPRLPPKYSRAAFARCPCRRSTATERPNGAGSAYRCVRTCGFRK